MEDRRPPSGIIEITRSFSFKLNVGNYESRDFFCSQKAECFPEEAERIAEALHTFCKAMTMRAVNAYIAENGVRSREQR